MKLTCQKIAEMVGGTLLGNPSREIHGVAGLAEATEKDISFFANVKYAEALLRTRAAAVLVPRNYGEFVRTTLIQVVNPLAAYARVLEMYARDHHKPPEGIHPTAVIHPTAKLGPGVAVGAHGVIEQDAEIGAGTVLYPQCYIGARTRLGEGCVLYPQVSIREECQIGARVILHSGVVIGSDGYGFIFQEGRHHKIPQIGAVEIGDDVELGANVTIDRATTGKTVVGRGTKVDNLVHIAHNVHIGEHCLIVAQVGISGSTRIGNGVTLAGQVGITGHLTIGDGAVVAAQSGVMNDVPPGAVVFGSPSRPHKEAMKIQAILGKLPEMYEFFKKLKRRS